MAEHPPEPNQSGSETPPAEPSAAETWSTRVGVILAVTGSAVGLGNFLRFPGVAAEFGGTFMVPYLLAFVLIGIPVALVEWTLGRYGGRNGFNSVPGVFRAVSGNRRGATLLGVLGVLVPMMVYTYYIYVVGWCLAYAVFYATGGMTAEAVGGDYESFFATFVGQQANGAAYLNPLSSPLIYVIIAFALNFVLIYRGLSKGIERFCQLAMPTLVICAVIVLIRVLTLGTPDPEGAPQQNIYNGLGYMWNPVPQADQLVPGDDMVQRLLNRSTAEAASFQVDDSGRLESMQIQDPEAFVWALREAGWEREATEDGDTPAREGEWRHGDARVALTVEGDTARFTGPRVEQIVVGDGEQTSEKARQAPVNEAANPVQKLLRLMPRRVAETPGEDYFETIPVLDRAGFADAMHATGWQEPAEAGSHWQHDNSRIRIALNPQQAMVSVPGFWATLANPEIWLKAAGQIFFSLSVGFGVICTYASYMKPDDDVALSSITATSGNGFAEVVLAGLTIVPAGFIFLGPSFVANPPGLFGMGFVSLPRVFNQMPAGQFFGFLFFGLLFLAAMTSTLSLLQPAIAFLEEGLGLGRKASVSMLGFITALGAAFVMFFSAGSTALSTIDFWMANVCIFILATSMVILFGWVLGTDEAMAELERGAEIRLPRIIRPLIKYISPVFLIAIFIAWMSSQGLANRLVAIYEDPVARGSIVLVLAVLVLFVLLARQAIRRWEMTEKQQTEVWP